MEAGAGPGGPGRGTALEAGWERSESLFQKRHTLFQADRKLRRSASLQTRPHPQQISARVWELSWVVSAPFSPLADNS